MEGERERKKCGLGREELEDRGKGMLFWNIGGVGRLDAECWNYIKIWDFVSLCETWIEEKGINQRNGCQVHINGFAALQ